MKNEFSLSDIYASILDKEYIYASNMGRRS